MKIDIVTMEELQQFKTEFIREMRSLIIDNKPTQTTEWLRSIEVRKMLNISPGTLQNLRVSGTLPFKKIGGSMYYNKQEIEKMMKGE
ncbi:helix-turn-helix domain-containing protein [Pedobacter sp. ASV1-7]|uniref:helix-turn-helix domain-containing protein n=1 Tax=Pedobacter sp. ASV1-7 TaxID=3145237 RepID=UPI0032E8E35B